MLRTRTLIPHAVRPFFNTTYWKPRFDTAFYISVLVRHATSPVLLPHGIGCYWMALDGIKRYWIVLNGIGWY